MQEQTAPEQPETAASPRHRGSALALLSLAIIVYATDQLTKNWVVANLPEGRSVPVLGEFLQWYFVRNPGAAFSMASGATWVFTLLAAAVVGAIIWQVRHLGSRTWAIFFALLLGGVLGNLTDRLTRDPGFPVGHVIDFISTPWMFPWPLSPAIYNVADIGIVSAMCLFVLITILGLPIDGSPRSRGGKNGGDAEAIESEATDTDSTEEDPA
ncbi:MAG: signal peptidase II [Actinobacteria bacterium]|nr:signal peptidase II [Actinomycetota bacterium]